MTKKKRIILLIRFHIFIFINNSLNLTIYLFKKKNSNPPPPPPAQVRWLEQLTDLPFIMMTNPLPTISLPATHHLTPSHTHIPFFNDFFFLISPCKSSTPHSLLLRTFFFFFSSQCFDLQYLHPSLSLSLSPCGS